jgi:hypothetical protein
MLLLLLLLLLLLWPQCRAYYVVLVVQAVEQDKL